MPSDYVFLDSAYASALAAPDDDCHNRANELAAEIKGSNVRLVTTDAVILEIGDALSKPKYRPAASKLIRSILTARVIEVVPLTPAIVRRAFDLFYQRPDKGWGLTDCVSFIVMADRQIRRALTTDEHFEQAGFVAMLK